MEIKNIERERGGLVIVGNDRVRHLIDARYVSDVIIDDSEKEILIYTVGSVEPFVFAGEQEKLEELWNAIIEAKAGLV